MRVDDFDFALPESLIAQHPAAQRRASRMLWLDGVSGKFGDQMFTDLPQHLATGDVLVLNDTRVIKARLAAKKITGGRLEVFIERQAGTHEAFALIRASQPLRSGALISIDDAVSATVVGREGDLYRVRFSEPLEDVLEYHGSVPLPPYITHVPTPEDLERYQTVYAERPGAVAAPTAGLHFDTPMLDGLAARGVRIARVTLHVGAGTFQPVRVEQVADHRMHSERYNVPQATVDAIARHAPRAGAWWPWARPRCARWRAPRGPARCAPEAAKPTCSSRPDSGSAWSTGCSPISTCRSRRC